jgi:hypothetical protein
MDFDPDLVDYSVRPFTQQNLSPEPWVKYMIPVEHCGILVPKLAKEFGPYDSILDVGHVGITGIDIFWKEFGIPLTQMHALDIFEPNVSAAQKISSPDGPRFHLGNALDSEKIFGPKSFDIVIAGELIEHMTRANGKKLFSALEAVARKFVLFTTPCCFLIQDPENAPNDEWSKNPYQRHISGWYPEDFLSRDYQVVLNGGITPDGTYSFCGSQIVAYKVLKS